MLNVRPFKTNVTARKAKSNYSNTVVGEGTVICKSAKVYVGTVIGDGCLVCHNAVIREGCVIGNNVLIASNVVINPDVTIGNNVKIMDLTYITGGMDIGDNVFIAHGVMTTNDNSIGKNHEYNPPIVFKGARIGANATILPGVIVCVNSVVGAGSVVTRDVPPDTIVIGVPARIRK